MKSSDQASISINPHRHPLFAINHCLLKIGNSDYRTDCMEIMNDDESDDGAGGAAAAAASSSAARPDKADKASSPRSSLSSMSSDSEKEDTSGGPTLVEIETNTNKKDESPQPQHHQRQRKSKKRKQRQCDDDDDAPDDVAKGWDQSLSSESLMRMSRLALREVSCHWISIIFLTKLTIDRLKKSHYDLIHQTLVVVKSIIIIVLTRLIQRGQLVRQHCRHFSIGPNTTANNCSKMMP